MTKRLYDSDAYIKDFSATVLSCEERNGRFFTVLDQSAFYPGGGGQEPDSGAIASAPVLSVCEKDGVILHETAVPLSGRVECSIDFDLRFRRMQEHTGEHIVSGLFHRLYGANNVGFHMGSEDVTLDLDIELTAEQISKVEAMANRAVYDNVEVTAFYPDRNELDSLDFRSKLEFPEGAAVRIVSVKGYDLCACSATHVHRTGEIGIIKLLSFARYKGGVRIHMLAGQDAYEAFVREHDALTAAARRYSVKPEELSDALDRADERLSKTEREKAAYARALADCLVDQARSGIDGGAVRLSRGCALFFSGLFSQEELRYTVNSAASHFGCAAAFSGTDSEGYLFVLSSKDDSRTVLARLKDKISISGGGKADMVSGRTFVSAEEIVRAFGEL